jgi:hypothetical protein
VALESIISSLLDPILNKIKDLLGPFGKLFDILTRFWHNLTNLFNDIQLLVDSIQAEILAWRTFKENVAIRTRVINVKSAIDKTEELWQQVVAAKDAVIDLWKTLKAKTELGGNPTEEAEEAIADIEGSGLKGLVEKFPKLFKGLEKVLGFVTLVADALESIIEGIHDLQAIVNALSALRREIEELDTVFLSQKNRRKTVRLTAGGSMKIRVGNLHR